jgi:hypothetical protein
MEFDDNFSINLRLIECDEGQQKIALKRQIEGYLDRVEAIKSNGQLLVRVRLHSQVRICDNDTGYDYETLFGVCFGDGVTQIDVEDPYIQNHYQVIQFVSFGSSFVLFLKPSF